MSPLPPPFMLLDPPLPLEPPELYCLPPPKKKRRLPAPKLGRINFPKRHSAVSLGKLEEGWKRDKGKGMRPGKAAAESKDSLTYGQAMLSFGFFEGYSLHLFDF